MHSSSSYYDFWLPVLAPVLLIILCSAIGILYIRAANMDPTQDFNFFSKSFAADSGLSFVSGLNPTPSFPTYSGPYPVGTLDVEIPASEVLSPSPSPDPSISTVSFRVFYPCNPPKEGPKSVYWLPDPQRQYIKAYAQFLGASSNLSGFLQSVCCVILERLSKVLTRALQIHPILTAAFMGHYTCNS